MVCTSHTSSKFDWCCLLITTLLKGICGWFFSVVTLKGAAKLLGSSKWVVKLQRPWVFRRRDVIQGRGPTFDHTHEQKTIRIRLGCLTMAKERLDRYWDQITKNLLILPKYSTNYSLFDWPRPLTKVNANFFEFSKWICHHIYLARSFSVCYYFQLPHTSLQIPKNYNSYQTCPKYTRNMLSQWVGACLDQVLNECLHL